ncbi:MAG: hypothetical protein R3F43_01680 [bacterium]
MDLADLSMDEAQALDEVKREIQEAPAAGYDPGRRGDGGHAGALGQGARRAPEAAARRRGGAAPGRRAALPRDGVRRRAASADLPRGDDRTPDSTPPAAE